MVFGGEKCDIGLKWVNDQCSHHIDWFIQDGNIGH